MMTENRAIEVIKNEAKCISSKCNKDCDKCNLSMDINEILEAFSLAIKELSKKNEKDKA